MSDIFISYAREDRSSAERLAEALEGQGWSVWWDPEIPAGKTFDEVIEHAIESARSIVVIWSKRSVKSRWVRTEAAEGADRRILVPVLIEDVRIPLAFKRIQAANLAEWDGTNSHLAFQKLVKDIASMLGPPPVAVAEEQHQAERKRQEEAERLKAKEEAAKREATLEAKRKADEEKSKRAEEEARRKVEVDKRRLAEQETQRKIKEARNPEEEAAKRRAEEAPASEMGDPTHPTVPPASSRSLLAKIAALGGIVVVAIFFVLIMLNEREPVQETYPPATDMLPETAELDAEVVGKYKKVNALLRECQTHFDANRLTTGRGGNAADCYEEVLKQDRGNPEALEGLTAIKNQYLSWAEKALQQGRLEKAKSYIAKIELFNPEGDAVLVLKEQLRNAERDDDLISIPKTSIVPPPVATTNQRLVGEMIPIKGGCFQTGSPADEERRDGDERQHRVCVGDFKIGKTEVTQQQWHEVMGSNPSFFKDCDDCPVEQVSWNNVQDFLQKLNARSGMKFRLPTEAEWEYAARAETTGPFSFQGKISADKVNYDANYTYEGSNKGKYREKTVPVGSLPANPWGLHEVHGNVWEWTCSAYDENYGGSEEKCAGRNNSGLRVLRGGSWLNEPRDVRSANRYRNVPDRRSLNIGFRLAQD